MKTKGMYSSILDMSEKNSYLVPNQDLRGVGVPYVKPSGYLDASLAVDPTVLTGSGIQLAAIPSPITGKYIQLPDGTVTAPGLAWAGEVTSGRYRIGLANFGESVLGDKVFDWNATRLRLDTGFSLDITDMTLGSVLFAGTNGRVTQDNAHLFYDDTNNYLGVGTNTPQTVVEIRQTGSECLRLSTSLSAYTAIQGGNTFAMANQLHQYVFWDFNDAAGVNVNVTSWNTDNSDPGSNAFFQAMVGGASSGDPYFRAVLNGPGTGWSFGLDNSDSDKWKLSRGLVLGTNDALYVNTSLSTFIKNMYVFGTDPWADVVAYGADPTGVSDSTTAINAALTAVGATTYGGTVYFPAGKYKVTSTLNLPNKPTKILGTGDSSRIDIGSNAIAAFTQAFDHPYKVDSILVTGDSATVGQKVWSVTAAVAGNFDVFWQNLNTGILDGSADGTGTIEGIVKIAVGGSIDLVLSHCFLLLAPTATSYFSDGIGAIGMMSNTIAIAWNFGVHPRGGVKNGTDIVLQDQCILGVENFASFGNIDAGDCEIHGNNNTLSFTGNCRFQGSVLNDLTLSTASPFGAIVGCLFGGAIGTVTRCVDLTAGANSWTIMGNGFSGNTAEAVRIASTGCHVAGNTGCKVLETGAANTNVYYDIDDNSTLIGAASTKINTYASTSSTTPQAIFDQASTGDCSIRQTLAAGNSWAHGIDNSDADSWKLSYGSAGNAVLGTNDYIAVLVGGNVGIGTTGPDRKLDILDASAAQLRLTYTDGSVFTDFQALSDNNLLITPSGSGTVRISQVLRAEGSNAPTTGAGLELGYNAGGTITSFNRTGAAYTSLTLEGLTILLNSNTGNSVGVGKTPSCQLDVAQVIRACGSNAPSTGAGVEIGATTITSFNRGTSAYTALGIDCSALSLNVNSGGDIKWGKPLVALGGGAAPTLGTIGGSGPATAAQNTWMRVLDSAGNAFFVPAWK